MYLLSSYGTFGMSVVKPTNNSDLLGGRKYTFQWEDVKGAEKYVLEYNFGTGFQTLQLQGNTLSNNIDLTLPCNAVPYACTFKVRAEEKKRGKWRKMDEANISFGNYPDNSPLIPELLLTCGQFTGTVCLPKDRYVGLNVSKRPNEAVYVPEDRNITWFDDPHQATYFIAGLSNRPVHNGLCYTPPAFNAPDFKAYYAVAKSPNCAYPNPGVYTVIAFPELKLNLNKLGQSTTLIDDSNLPAEMRCTVPGTFFSLPTTAASLIPGNIPAGIKSLSVEWFHYETNDQQHISFDSKTQTIRVCYSDIYPELYRDYLCKASSEFEYFDPNSNSKKTINCTVSEAIIRIYRALPPEIGCEQINACKGGPYAAQLNATEIALPFMNYDWSPKIGLSSYSVPNPNVIYTELPEGITKYTMRRKLRSETLFGNEIDSYFCSSVYKAKSKYPICLIEPRVGTGGKENEQIVSTVDVSNNGLELFPNPTRSYVDLVWSTPAENQDLIRLFDYMGKEVVRYTPQAHDSAARLELNLLPTGLYICTYEDQNGMLLSKQRLMIVNP